MMIRPAVLALAMSFAFTLGTVPAFAADPQESTAVAVPTATPTAPPADELARLSEREAATPALQDFRGGDYDAVYIGGGGVGLLVLIILLILIIH